MPEKQAQTAADRVLCLFIVLALYQDSLCLDCEPA